MKKGIIRIPICLFFLDYSYLGGGLAKYRWTTTRGLEKCDSSSSSSFVKLYTPSQLSGGMQWGNLVV